MNIEPRFFELATKIMSEGRTMLKLDRLFTIYQVIQKAEENTIALEIGVYRGGTSRFMAILAAEKSIKVHAIDTFTGHKSAIPVIDGVHRNNIQFTKTSFASVNEYLHDLNNITLHQCQIEDFDLSQIQNVSIVHLDTDLKIPTKYALDNIAPRLVRHGVIIVDDYGKVTTPGIRESVSEFLNSNKGVYFSLHLLTSQFLIIKL